MKKLSKAICFTLLLGLICLCFSMTVFAETESGDLGNGFSYRIDHDAKTVTIYGKGQIPEETSLLNLDFDIYQNYTLIINDGVENAPNNYYWFKKVFLGKDVQDLPIRSNYFAGNDIYYELDPQNSYFSIYNNCLYTKDFKKLVYYFPDKEPNDFHPNLQIIGKGAFIGYCGPTSIDKTETIVIPWGVTTIEDDAFTSPDAIEVFYVIPDTAVHLGTASDDGEHGPTHYHFPLWIPSRNNPTAWNTWMNGKMGLPQAYLADQQEYHSISDIPYDNIASYYDLKPNSLKTFQNGKTYYFDSNYKMLKGWNYADGTWYYFNDYGAAVVKIWLKSGGKWYFMQADGTMATNKWIQWYGKWYYVGSDGAMYANRYTPDGYWVNANGVWVK
ncbi:MAG: hypothetical protein DBY45_08620 [Clostridiales bacterium]|nr:MAG: hypothetical protein DBY45_08620 [Clostridiales bacterium]